MPFKFGSFSVSNSIERCCILYYESTELSQPDDIKLDRARTQLLVVISGEDTITSNVD